MKVYDITKTKELIDYDLNLGHLEMDTITRHLDEVQEVEEKSHVEVLKEYPNGGKDVITIVDEPYIPYQPARDEIESVLIYVPYTAEELEKKEKEVRMNEIQSRLDKLSQDFIQAYLGADFGTKVNDQGEVVNILDERKEEFRKLHNELRVLQNKTERIYKGD